MNTLNSPQLYFSSQSKNKFFLRQKVEQESCGHRTPNYGLQCQTLRSATLPSWRAIELGSWASFQHLLLWGMWSPGWCHQGSCNFQLAGTMSGHCCLSQAQLRALHEVVARSTCREWRNECLESRSLCLKIWRELSEKMSHKSRFKIRRLGSKGTQGRNGLLAWISGTKQEGDKQGVRPGPEAEVRSNRLIDSL